MPYTTIDNSILQSSILLEDLPTRWLWTVMLILADQTRETKGVVDCPVERLAQLANLTISQTRRAMERLSSPDDKSSSKEDEGRRIVPCETVEGFETRKWRLVNWQKYKDEIRKAQMAAASRKYRQGKRLPEPVIDRHQASSSVMKPSPSISTPSPTQSPTPKRKPRTHGAEVFVRPSMEELRAYIEEKNLTIDPTAWYSYYVSNGWKVGRNPMQNWKAAVWTWVAKENSSGSR